MERLITCVIIGGGQRGKNYSEYAEYFPEQLNIVAIVDPNPVIQTHFQRKCGIKDEYIFTDYKELTKCDKIAEVVLICTPDRTHKEIAVAMSRKGYHILLEKPMATNEQDCIEIAQACRESKVMLCVCHVLRYFPPNCKIKEIIQSGIIGDVVTIQHLEPVGFYHFAHSYVRGNWRNEKESSFSLLGKSCHDIDLIQFWMDKKCTKISSFGSLQHFNKSNKPKNASDRCLTCSVESTCPYSAKQIYLDRAKCGYYGWPVSIVTDIEDLQTVEENLKDGPYGRCVYECDNDVCDNQVVNMEFEGGQTASFTMIAFTESICQRRTNVFGTKGELTYTGGSNVKHYDFLTRKTTNYNCTAVTPAKIGGHDGADYQLMVSFLRAIMTNDPSCIKSGIEDSLESHCLVFAAENSRVTGQTMYLQSDKSWSNNKV